MLKGMLHSAGIDDANKSNHGLRATGISRLYQSGLPEKLIMERPGHISSDGVRAYERSTDKQHQVVSEVWSGYTGELVPSSKTEPAVGELVSSVKEEPAPVEALPQSVSEAAGIIKRQLHFQDLTGCTVNINMKF